MKLLNFLLLALVIGTSSVHAQNASEWTKYSSPEGKYNVLLPGEPTLTTNEATNHDGKPLLQHTATVVSDGGALMVTYFDYGPDSQFKMEAAREGLLKSISGTVETEQAITLGGVAGQSFTLHGKTDKGLQFIDRATIVDVNRRVYIIQCLFVTTDDGPKVVEKCKYFSSSFNLAKP